MLEIAVLVLSILGNIVLGYISYRSNTKSATNKAFGCFVIVNVLWLLATYLANNAASPELAIVLVRITMLLAALQIYSIFIFIHTFPETSLQLKGKKFIASIILTTIVSLVAISPYMFTKVASIKPASPEPGPGIVLFILHILIFFGGAIYLFIRKTLHAQGELKQQLKFLTYGVIVTFGLIAISNFVLIVVFKQTGLSFLTPAYTMILIAAITYSILNFHLFDVKLILTEVATAIVIIALLIQTLLSKGASQIATNIVILLIVTYGGWLLIKSIIQEISRREVIEKLAAEKTKVLEEVEDRNKNLAGLQKIADIVLNESEMKAMTQSILNQIPQQINGCICALLYMKEGNNLVSYALSDFAYSKEVYHLVGNSLEKFSLPIEKEDGLINQAFNTKKPTESENLTDFMSPPLPKSVTFHIQKMIKAQYHYAMPLHSAREDVGVLLFVFSSTKETVTTQELDMIEAISNEMNLAIQRVMAYKKLKEANEYLTQVDKMKDEFLSMASHELNTPLAAIEGYLSMILDENIGKIDDKSRTFLDRAYASSKRLAGLILDLLNVSRIEQGRLQMKFDEVNMAELAQDVIHELQVRADGKKVYLKLEADPKKIPSTFCDQQRIREVITNLAGNAIKFTEKGGVTIVVTANTQKITVEVKDTGRGISREDQARLFQKFSQVNREKDQQQGTGLGLYISKNYVELHKGKIWIESEVGKGTTFTFELPVMKEVPKSIDGANVVNNADSKTTFSGQTMPKATPTAEQLKTSTITQPIKTESVPVEPAVAAKTQT